ncbi:MAG: DUF4406 domain-containing protein [Mycobacteriaceae bacterium]
MFEPGTSTCYVAGPMRGLAEFNFPAFDSLAAYMRKHEWLVFNPAEHDREVDPGMESQPAFAIGDVENLQGFSFHEAMRWDLRAITHCDAIVFLPGWERSTGAGHEKYVAEVCGVEVLYAFPLDNGEWFVSEVDIDRTGAV